MQVLQGQVPLPTLLPQNTSICMSFVTTLYNMDDKNFIIKYLVQN